MKTMIELKCVGCSIYFSTFYERRKQKFCSRSCQGRYYVGEKAMHWQGGKKNTSCKNCYEALVVWPYELKDSINNFCSKSCSAIYNTSKRKVHPVVEFSKSHQDEKSPTWKGKNVGYTALHSWVRKHLGRPNTCELCKESGFTNYQIHWANISGKYKRDLTDWARLCAGCHLMYDGTNPATKDFLVSLRFHASL